MKIAKLITIVAMFTMLVTPVFAARDDSKAFGQFQEFLEGIDQKSFETIRKYVDQADLTNRVLSHQAVQADVQDMFRNDFWNAVERGILHVLPPKGSRVKPELIQFEFENGKGRAVVRFSYPNYEFQFQQYDLRYDGRGRLKVVDWFDSSKGETFSAFMGEELLAAKPEKEASRKLLSSNAPTDLQLFQATEILKAIRDRQAPRFFEIYDKFDEPLKREPWIAKNAVYMAQIMKDVDRFSRAVVIFADLYSEDPDMGLMLSDYYVTLQDYEQSFAALQKFEQHFSVSEGALPAKLSALALAIGRSDDAEKFAVKATTSEPELELGWWSLLRARSVVEDYQGALEALTHLEDDFGHRLDAGKLGRDKFRAFTKLAASQEFKDWRAQRNQQHDR